MKAVIEGYLRQNEDFASNLREGAAEILTQTIRDNYVERQGSIVDRKTNLVADVGDLFRDHARSLIKSRGTGRYVGKYADRRTPAHIEEHKSETRKEMEAFLNKRPEKYISQDITRTFIERIAENFVVESNGDGGFNLARLFKGQKIDVIKPEDTLGKISPYVDGERTALETKRLKAKFRQEALTLEGFSLEDARDPKNKRFFDETVKQIERDYFRQPVKKKAPEANVNDLKADLQKEYGHVNGLPVDQRQWTAKELMHGAAYGDREIEHDKGKAWESFDTFTRERTPAFYKNSREEYTGLDYNNV